MQKTLIKSLLLIIAFTFALSANYIFAVWTGPTQVPPGGNTPTPVHVGATDQVKDAGLSLNSLAVFGNGFFDGNVGIGVTNPQAKLDVAGKIKVGDDSSAPIAGSIRWTGSDLEVYDGTEWKSLTVSSVTTQAGLPFYGTNSTVESTTRKEQCQTAGGTVTDFQSNSFCKFQASSCPSGWTRYQNLGSTSSKGCDGSTSYMSGCNWGYSVYCSGGSCATGNHNFINEPIETCGYTQMVAGCKQEQDQIASGICSPGGATCSATLTEVGCY